MRKNPIDYGLFGTIALCAPLFSILWLVGCNGQTEAQQAAQAPEVAVVVIQPQRVELSTELPGRTSPYRIAEIRPQVNGIVQKRLFQEGADVKAGQLLYQIDSAPFQVAHESARASLAKAQANLPSLKLKAERYKELLAEDAVSRQDYDDAAASVEQSRAEVEYWKAAVEAARINLGYTRVAAPISGRIGKSSVTDGALVTAYQPAPLAVIQQLDPIYVDVTQSSAELLRLRRNLESGRLSRRRRNQQEGAPAPRGRDAVPPGRHPAVPGRHRGPHDRVVHPAHRGPESAQPAAAGDVPARGRAGGRDGAGHPGPPAGHHPNSQGGTRRMGRG